MSYVIYKYVLNQGRNWVSLPRGARIICCNDQHDCTAIWALVDPAAEPEERIFEVIPTGLPFATSEIEDPTYVGTCFFEGGRFVLHVFEVQAKEE